MKKAIIISIALLILLILVIITPLLSIPVGIDMLSVCPFALFFVTFVMGVGDVRFKDDEDDKLTKEECSLPMKKVAQLRHDRGLTYMLACIPEVFLVFFVQGIAKVIIAAVVMAIALIASQILWKNAVKKACAEEESKK